MSEEEIKTVRGDVISDEVRMDEVQPTYYVTDDEKLLTELLKDPDLKALKPLYSRLMRLTKISTKEKELFQVDIDLIIGTMEADMAEADFDSGRWAKLQAHAIFLKTMINDSHKGFKMTLLSRLRKEVVVSAEKKPSRWRR